MTIVPAIAWALAVLGIALYLLPTAIAVRRDAAATTEVVLLNLAFGWTGFGWAWALVLACGVRRPRPPLPPPTRPIPPLPPLKDEVYRDGAYLLSRGPDTFTWAICKAGRWTIVYEMDGADRLFGDVDACDIPFGVLTEAMLSATSSR